jgi:hypothetical protein
VSVLTLKSASSFRQSGEWNDDDYDVLADGIVVGRIMKGLRPLLGCHGFGRSPLGTTRIARLRTAMQRAARTQWRRSPRADGGSELRNLNSGGESCARVSGREAA